MSQPVKVPSPLFMVPGTGELLSRTELEDVATGMQQITQLRQELDELAAALEQTLIQEYQRTGNRHMRFENGLIVEIVGGGTRNRYDQPERLLRALEDAGCPTDTLEQAVAQILIHKASGHVLNQLRKANPAYQVIIDEHKTETIEPLRVKIG